MVSTLNYLVLNRLNEIKEGDLLGNMVSTLNYLVLNKSNEIKEG